MRSIVNKIIISVFTVTVIVLTMFATTYAWVGILNYSSVNDFKLNLNTDSTNKYSLLISSTGLKDSFSSQVSTIEIQKQIIENRGISISEMLDNEKAIDYYFNNEITLGPTTPIINSASNSIDGFEELTNFRYGGSFIKSDKFFKFDLYFAIEPDGELQIDTNISTDLIFKNISTAITGTISNCNLINQSKYFISPSYDKLRYPILNTLPSSFYIDSMSSARLAFELYYPININDSYENLNPEKLIIFQGGTSEPSISNNVYSMGGILPEEYNLAIQEINSIYHLNLKPNESLINRDEKELIDENQFIFSSDKEKNSTYYLGIKNGIQTKIKMSVYFWFEGWDADCLSAIDRKKVNLNLVFSPNNKE